MPKEPQQLKIVAKLNPPEANKEIGKSSILVEPRMRTAGSNTTKMYGIESESQGITRKNGRTFIELEAMFYNKGKLVEFSQRVDITEQLGLVEGIKPEDIELVFTLVDSDGRFLYISQQYDKNVDKYAKENPESGIFYRNDLIGNLFHERIDGSEKETAINEFTQLLENENVIFHQPNFTPADAMKLQCKSDIINIPRLSSTISDGSEKYVFRLHINLSAISWRAWKQAGLLNPQMLPHEKPIKFMDQLIKQIILTAKFKVSTPKQLFLQNDLGQIVLFGVMGTIAGSGEQGEQTPYLPSQGPLYSQAHGPSNDYKDDGTPPGSSPPESKPPKTKTQRKNACSKDILPGKTPFRQKAPKRTKKEAPSVAIHFPKLKNPLHLLNAPEGIILQECRRIEVSLPTENNSNIPTKEALIPKEGSHKAKEPALQETMIVANVRLSTAFAEAMPTSEKMAEDNPLNEFINENIHIIQQNGGRENARDEPHYCSRSAHFQEECRTCEGDDRAGEPPAYRLGAVQGEAGGPGKGRHQEHGPQHSFASPYLRTNVRRAADAGEVVACEARGRNAGGAKDRKRNGKAGRATGQADKSNCKGDRKDSIKGKIRDGVFGWLQALQGKDDSETADAA